jgi:hypothetical protein
MIRPNGKSQNKGFDPFYEDAKEYVKASAADTSEGRKEARQNERMTAAQRAAELYASKYAGNSAVSPSHSIGRAQAGGLSDVGGTVRQMKSATTNSIWDTSVLDKLAEQETEGEKISANKKLEEAHRQERKIAERNEEIDLDTLKELIANGELARGSRISSVSASDDESYHSHIPSGSISMFDDGDFDRIPEKSSGESIKEAAEARAMKKKADTSWKKGHEASSSRAALDRFFSNIEKSGE